MHFTTDCRELKQFYLIKQSIFYMYSTNNRKSMTNNVVHTYICTNELAEYVIDVGW